MEPKIGLIGAGRFANALATGWDQPLLVHDPVTERAESLAARTGGEALSDNLQVAAAADVVVLCHHAAQLSEVADEIKSQAKCVVSVLGYISLSEIQSAYGDVPTFRVLPNMAVEVKKGVVSWSNENGSGEAAETVEKLFSRIGQVVKMDDRLVSAATAISASSPAFMSVVVEALVDAGVNHGIPAEISSSLVIEMLIGTAALLKENGADTLALRRAVAFPGGSTARGLAAIDQSDLRGALGAAVRGALSKPPQ